MWRARWWLCGLLLWAGIVNAAEVHDMHVSRDGPAYDVSARLRVDVARRPAFQAATRFEALAKRARLIRSSHRLGPHRLQSTLSMCVLFYCKAVTQVMDYHLHAPRRLDMQAVPDAGDLKRGEAHWRFVAVDAGHTDILFSAALVPDFWVPPVVGGWALSHALGDQIADTGRAIEALAESTNNSHAVAPVASYPSFHDR